MDESKVGLLPVFFPDSKVLILGSFPSVKSRAVQFYYGHKQNRFWRTVCGYFQEKIPPDTVGKVDFLKRRKIALWDMIMACEIVGSADNTVKEITATDLDIILSKTKIEKILLNGKLAYDLFFERYQGIDIPFERLPSTSPANPRFDENVWRRALDDVFRIT